MALSMATNDAFFERVVGMIESQLYRTPAEEDAGANANRYYLALLEFGTSLPGAMFLLPTYQVHLSHSLTLSLVPSISPSLSSFHL